MQLYTSTVSISFHTRNPELSPLLSRSLLSLLFFLLFDNPFWVIETTYSLVHVDGVLAGNHVRNGGALSRLL